MQFCCYLINVSSIRFRDRSSSPESGPYGKCILNIYANLYIWCPSFCLQTTLLSTSSCLFSLRQYMSPSLMSKNLLTLQIFLNSSDLNSPSISTLCNFSVICIHILPNTGHMVHALCVFLISCSYTWSYTFTTATPLVSVAWGGLSHISFNTSPSSSSAMCDVLDNPLHCTGIFFPFTSKSNLFKSPSQLFSTAPKFILCRCANGLLYVNTTNFPPAR